MRPARFQQLLLDAANSLPGAAAKAFADAGHTRHPFGVAVEAGGRTSNWQIVVVGFPGETWGEADPEPALGEKPAAIEAPALTSDLSTVEQALVAQLLASAPGEIAAVETYSTRPNPPAVGHGATLDMHDGSKVFINHVR
jgi:hypothetical protein